MERSNVSPRIDSLSTDASFSLIFQRDSESVKPESRINWIGVFPNASHCDKPQSCKR